MSKHNLTTTKKDVATIAAVLRDGEFDSADEAAAAVLEAAWDLYEAKSKFIIVGQLYYAPGEGFIQPEDPRALKVALGPYGTESQANKAQASLLYSGATGEEFRRWVLPIHHGTPNTWFVARKKAREQAEIDARQPLGLPREEAA